MAVAIGAVQLSKLVYTVKEVAVTLGLSTDTVYEMVRSGVLPHIRIGRRILIPRKSLELEMKMRVRGGAFHLAFHVP